MTIKETIQNDLQKSRKSVNPKEVTFLSTILGELDRIGKNPIDSDSIKVLKKMLDGIKETSNDINEIEYITDFLPKLMSKEEIETAVNSIIENNNSKEFSVLMREFQKNYKGKADNNMVKEVINQIIK